MYELFYKGKKKLKNKTIFVLFPLLLFLKYKVFWCYTKNKTISSSPLHYRPLNLFHFISFICLFIYFFLPFKISSQSSSLRSFKFQFAWKLTRLHCRCCQACKLVQHSSQLSRSLRVTTERCWFQSGRGMEPGKGRKQQGMHQLCKLECN